MRCDLCGAAISACECSLCSCCGARQHEAQCVGCVDLLPSDNESSSESEVATTVPCYSDDSDCDPPRKRVRPIPMCNDEVRVPTSPPSPSDMYVYDVRHDADQSQDCVVPECDGGAPPPCASPSGDGESLDVV
jgi:hypothetical protein